MGAYAFFLLPLREGSTAGRRLSTSPFPLAGKGLGMGVSAPGLPSSLRPGDRPITNCGVAPPPLTPPRKGEGNDPVAALSHDERQAQ